MDNPPADTDPAARRPTSDLDELDDEPNWSTYRDATKGPTPVPSWVVTDPRAIDTDHGVLKTGKEADVSLLDRPLASSIEPASTACWRSSATAARSTACSTATPDTSRAGA